MCDNEDDYHEPSIPTDHVLCPRCNGDGEIACHCGGDLCVCGEEEQPCPLCGGEYGGDGYVSRDTADRYWKRQHEIRDAIRKVMEGNADG
ncbi:hypothetical protein CCR97_07955 [Rhodoplanes elegans]|uniref:Uncharacterized protein n=1 Tax=Rhodoplanes elegans TaxID=29408 RepID=A0A327KPW0_9BRAD|nr:hypothetical protein [Rhodoplanes elegans]MBK5958052.1 hypothetical protein [Rhodoplanes elegans]MBK5958144.1 hypothetical protein [Rhodoplanes elegans]RAI40431.1 hypothetical protein CH338_06205 [Rhodoplanes elegans]